MTRRRQPTSSRGSTDSVNPMHGEVELLELPDPKRTDHSFDHQSAADAVGLIVSPRFSKSSGSHRR